MCVCLYIYYKIVYTHTVGYARTNVIGSRPSFVIASVRSAYIEMNVCVCLYMYIIKLCIHTQWGMLE